MCLMYDDVIFQMISERKISSNTFNFHYSLLLFPFFSRYINISCAEWDVVFDYIFLLENNRKLLTQQTKFTMRQQTHAHTAHKNSQTMAYFAIP